MRNSIKKLALGVIALGAFSLTACMSSGSSVGPEANSAEKATVFVTAKMKNVNTLGKPGLAKLSPITLTTLRITAISNVVPGSSLDTVVHTFAVGDTISGNDTLSHDAEVTQNFAARLDLTPLRSWTITVETLDDEGSVIQAGTKSLGVLYAGEIKTLGVDAFSLYNNYKANFNFADSITSYTGTVSRQEITITSFSMEIAADFAVDSAADFNAGVATNVAHTLNIFKVDTALGGASSAQSVYLNVYGYLPQADSSLGGTASAPILLYSGSKLLKELSSASATNVDLEWKGPTMGKVEDLTISISKVGTIEIDAVTPPTVID